MIPGAFNSSKRAKPVITVDNDDKDRSSQMPQNVHPSEIEPLDEGLAGNTGKMLRTIHSGLLPDLEGIKNVKRRTALTRF